MNDPLVLLPLGFIVGTFGTLIGAGGGFILMPVLLMLYPEMGPEILTGFSLTIVFFNAASGSVAYAYKRRIDYRSALLFSLAAAPGAIIGAYITAWIPRKNFEFGFGLLMICISAYLLIDAKNSRKLKNSLGKNSVRLLTDREGTVHTISYDTTVGLLVSVAVGFVSSLLGIGGGIIHVPALVRILGFPVHIATATSHAILAVVSLIGVIEHIIRGDLNTVVTQILWLAPAVVVGAQLGAYLSLKVKDTWIIKALAVGLFSVGVRFILL